MSLLKMDTSEVDSDDHVDNEEVGENDRDQVGQVKTDEMLEAEGVSATEKELPQKKYEVEGDGCEDEEGSEAEVDEEAEGFFKVDDEDDDTTTLSSEAVVDDIELILMPEMCQDLPSANLSPKLVRVTELKIHTDDVFCDDDDADETDEDQSSRHEFRSIVDEVYEEEGEKSHGDSSAKQRLSMGEEDMSSGSELLVGTAGRRSTTAGLAGEFSKSSSSSGGRRRRSTSGRINSEAQTEITAVEEPAPLSGESRGFRKKSVGKSKVKLGNEGAVNAKKLNWKSELTLLPSKMKVKQCGFNSFESNDERDQYSPRVAKFTSQDTLNLSSQFLKPSTLYRTRNLSRNLNQFASSESTFMLPMTSEQQLTSCGLSIGESSRAFRERVSSSTSTAVLGGNTGNFRGAATSVSAYQISSMFSGSSSGVTGCVSGANPLSSARVTRHPPYYGPYGGGQHGPLISSSGNGESHIMLMNSRQFRSSMPDLAAIDKSYSAGVAASMADSHRRRQHGGVGSSKSIKHSSSVSSTSRHRRSHHHSSNYSGGCFRLQKRSSSDEETSSLIDESERCLRSSIDLLLTDELPSPAGVGDASCFRSPGFGGSSAANIGGLGVTGGGYSYSSRRSCSQPILNEQVYPPEMKDSSMGSPFLPRKLSDMRCSRWAKVILPNSHVAVVAIKDTDETQNNLLVQTDTGCVINLPFRKVVFAWKSSQR